MEKVWKRNYWIKIDFMVSDRGKKEYGWEIGLQAQNEHVALMEAGFAFYAEHPGSVITDTFIETGDLVGIV